MAEDDDGAAGVFEKLNAIARDRVLRSFYEDLALYAVSIAFLFAGCLLASRFMPSPAAFGIGAIVPTGIALTRRVTRRIRQGRQGEAPSGGQSPSGGSGQPSPPT